MDRLRRVVAAGAAREAQTLVARLTDAYERAYYTGIVCERKARALLKQRNVVRSAVYEGLARAMEWYERAEAIRFGLRASPVRGG